MPYDYALEYGKRQQMLQICYSVSNESRLAMLEINDIVRKCNPLDLENPAVDEMEVVEWGENLKKQKLRLKQICERLHHCTNSILQQL